MMDEQQRWGLIDAAAKALGVNAEARKKWRKRGVPHKWRLPVIQKAGGALTYDQMHPIQDHAASGTASGVTHEDTTPFTEAAQ